MLTVALINRYPIVLRGLEIALKNGIKQSRVILANDFGEFKKNNKKVQPQIFILGLNEVQPEETIANITEIKNIHPLSSVVTYGDQTRPEIAINFLRSGAKGFLSTGSDLSELADCVESVLNGNRYLSSVHMWQLFDHLIKQTNKTPDNHPELSKRQYEIAQYLIQGSSTSCIAKKLSVSNATISTTKKNLFKKLGIDNVVQLSAIVNHMQ